jgi:Asp-tRNA(Asn)/Glu-tRNA(Gln) amidotransferase A subunit family amidase
MLDATALAAAIAAGNTTAVATTAACLDRIAARDAVVKAWAHLDPAQAWASAAASDAVPVTGPLRGVPIGVKDVILTRDMPTAYNSPLYEGHQPGLDAACVALLRRAGATILGKTATVEFASIGRVAATTNPHAPGHTPGGSSSGSAAAVADGQVPIALGTQTGGSIIRPASFCGVWALKPTWGTVSGEGMKPFAPSLDTLGWFARSARDLGLMLRAFDPPATPDPTPATLRRIAVWRTPGWASAGPATGAALTTAIDRLVAAGIAVADLALPAWCDGLAEAQLTIMMAEGRRSFLHEYRTGAPRLHPRIVAMVENAAAIGPDQLRDAHDLAARARHAFDAAAAEHDAVLAPSTICEAPEGLSSTGDLIFNGLFTLMHVPCINLPLFRAANGLPVGLTLTGPRYADHQLVGIAEQLQSLFADRLVVPR